MIKNLYMHFQLEHLYGHHKYLGTPADPATAKLNQTFYSFFFNTLVYSFKNSWSREIKSLKKQGKSPYSYENRFLTYLFLEILFTLVVFYSWGTKGLVFFLIQACTSITILEIINYAEHYGLKRKEISPGVYEKITIRHS